ncbi:MAG: hypothetical protein ABII97_03165 [Patescibacteria group bacterium]
MIYFVFGNDTLKGHEKFSQIVSELLKKDKNLSVFRFEEDNFDVNVFRDALKTEGLFFNKNLVIQKRVLKNAEHKEYILDNLGEISASENMFVFFEEGVKKKDLDEIKKHTKNIWEFSFDEKILKKKELSVYYKIMDLVASRKRDQAWLMFQKELLNGIDVEEVFWNIQRQIKNLLLVKKGGGEKLHPFVLSKTQKAVVLFQEKELKNYLSELNALHYKNRLGEAEFETGVEKFILKL